MAVPSKKSSSQGFFSPLRLVLIVGGGCAIILLLFVVSNRSSVSTQMGHANDNSVKVKTSSTTATSGREGGGQAEEGQLRGPVSSTSTDKSSSMEIDQSSTTSTGSTSSSSDYSAKTQTTKLTATPGFAKDLPSKPFHMKDYDTIFLYHTRIGGGGILREWLGKVCKLHNITLTVKEGYVLDDVDFKPSTRNQYNPTGRTLSITSVRDPIERALSAYWQEGKPDTTNFRHWVDTKATVDHNSHDFIWHCHSNCFTRWFGAESFDRAQYYDVHRAANRLSQFNVVVQAERLHDTKYTTSLQSLLDSKDIQVPYGPFGERMTAANITTTYGITKDEISLLQQRNQMDRDLMDLLFGV